MQPYGDIFSRLHGIASALTLGKEFSADVVIVWSTTEFDGFSDDSIDDAWDDLFAEPKLPLGCFPGGTHYPEMAHCKVHTINSRSEYGSLSWETTFGTSGTEGEVLCLRAAMEFTDEDREIEWFFKLLEPSQE